LLSGAAACAAIVLTGGLIVTVANPAAAGNGQLHGSSLHRDAINLQGSLQDFVRNRPDFDIPVAVAELIANAADDKETLDDADQSADADLSAEDAHEALLAEERYPPAATCGNCHPKHYREWSVSQHAYSQLSPVYLSLNNRINQLTNGSNGDFCLRCHNQVGANLGESSFVSNLERHPTSREGVTCVVCHRVNKAYNKASGRLALVEGTLTEPVFGPTGNEELARVLDNAQEYGVTTDPNARGQLIHKEAKQFAPISTPMFCGTCHDVTLFNGFRLEEAFSEYRLSPAAAKGVTCQDCHMGKVQGIPSGYDYGPAAVIFDVPTQPRKLTNHLFAGPDYSLIHPGIFPHNADAQEFATLEEWLQFDVAAGWGTDEFEDTVTDDTEFPEAWESIDDRYEAREIIDEQLELLEWVTEKRLEILRNGYILGDIVTDKADKDGIRFRVQVRNRTDGHNVPTGFTGERLVWLDVTVVDRDGTVVFRSGDRDPNGDIRDGHSSYVHAGEVELDPYLFSLQSIFVTQNGRGGEIEHVIPIPYPVFALPRVLPATASLVFTGEPATERNHKKGIEPLGQRWAEYKVAGSALTGKGPYRAIVKLMEQPVPVNLLTAIQSVGFDYGMTPRQVGDALIAGAQLLWERELTFDIE
jgi:nitrate/TMAO reductase-like tetraheme cytochrome c subunit